MLKVPTDLVAETQAVITEVSAGSNIDEYSLLIDVREPGEVALGRIPNSINLPRGVLEFEMFASERVKTVLEAADSPEQVPILLYCKSGARSALAAKALQDLGFENVASLIGGYEQSPYKGAT